MRAGIVIIGNEILSGKFADENAAFLIGELRALGVELGRIAVIPDDEADIAETVTRYAARFDGVFTSGGVGPTHDDITIEAVARAFGVPVVMSPVMEKMIRDHYGERCTDGHLRMALIPDGASLETTAAVPWPTIRFRNVWLMPGVPEVFRMKMPVVIEKIGQGGRAFVSRAVYTKMDEGDLRPLLDRVVASFPDVDVGSYPKWSGVDYRTKLTFDGRDEARVLAARDAFVALLPAGEPQNAD